ncbi:MAG: Glu-tRNA(Gln) amidotransferase subunit GatD [Candidatus Woesearchaeota archaeon]
MAKTGDRVKVLTAEETIEGVLMPDEKDFVVLKLDTGYNIGIDKKRIKEIILVKEYQPTKTAMPKAEYKKELPTIAILHTGGTIASRVDYETGGVIAQFKPEEMLEMFPELKEIANIRSRLIRQMFSEDMRFGHYNILAQEIEKEIKEGADGIIITHGTDTLHYTGAALSFILQNPGVPVILVGAQRSSDRGSTDAALNLISAAFFIVASKDFAEVALCMHENINDDWCVILPGTKSRKMHSSRRDAFQAINTEPWARVNYKERKVDLLRTGYRKRAKTTPTIRKFKENVRIGILKMHPNMSAQEIEFYKGYDGLIIEGTGLGHMPINEIDELTKEHTKITEAIKKLVQNGTIVAATTQTIHGGINMNVYSTGRKMQDLGIIGNYTDMTPETAFIKLAWLLSNYPKDKAKEMYSQNIAGEISQRLENVEPKKFK